MKNIKYSFLPILFLFIGFSCANENPKTEVNNAKPFKINNLELDLSLKLNNYTDVYFKTANLPSFTQKFSGDLYDENTFYIVSYPNYTLVRISSDAYDLKVTNNTSTMPAKSTGKATFTTCRNADCVAKTIKGAIGDGTKTVYIAVKPVKTLGKQTGVQVGYSFNPIVQQNVPMATALELEDGIDNENLTNIDGQLTAP